MLLGHGFFVACLLMLSSVNAEPSCVDQEITELSLLQTGSYMQRSSVPSDFFELEDFTSSSNPGKAAAAQAAGHRQDAFAREALFDVGSNAVPLPVAGHRSNLLSLAEVGGRPGFVTAADPDAAGVVRDFDAVGVDRDFDAPAVSSDAPVVEPTIRSALRERLQQLAKPEAELLSSKDGQLSHGESLQVFATEPPLAAAPVADVAQPALAKTQLKKENKEDEDSQSFFEEEAPEATVRFMEQQASAGGSNAMVADGQLEIRPAAAKKTVPAEHVHTRQARRMAAQEELQLQEAARDAQAAQLLLRQEHELAARVQARRIAALEEPLFQEAAREAHAAQLLSRKEHELAAREQRELQASPRQARSIDAQERQPLRAPGAFIEALRRIDAPRREEDFEKGKSLGDNDQSSMEHHEDFEKAVSMNKGLDETMRQLEDDEKRLLAALERR